MPRHHLVNNPLSISTLERTGACAPIFQLETGFTARTNFGPITCAFRPRRCDAIGARALVGFALGFVLAHLPPSATFCKLSSSQICLRILDIAWNADAAFITHYSTYHIIKVQY